MWHVVKIQFLILAPKDGRRPWSDLDFGGILRTLPLSGRQRVSGARSDFMVAFLLQGLVRRCRISTGSVCGPTPDLQGSSHLRFASHTRAQLQTQGRDHLQDGVKARTELSR